MVTIIEVVSQLMWVTIAIAISMFSYFFTPTGPQAGNSTIEQWLMICPLLLVKISHYINFPMGPMLSL